MKLKVAVLQLSPQLGAVKANIERANAILRAHGLLGPAPSSTSTSAFSATAGKQPQKQRQLDVLVLPELAFTGYNFKSPAEIEPFLEPTAAGVSTQWAQATSKAVGCHTLVGYPETASIDTAGGKQKKTYNSAVMVDPTGAVVFNYRKTFLYETDETWGCSEPATHTFNSGNPFPLTGSISVRGTKLRTQVGICMDLNPYKFTESPFEAYEFGRAAWRNKAQLVLLPTAWLHPESPDIAAKRAETGDAETVKTGLLADLQRHLMTDGQAPDLSTVNYWASRMHPFLLPNEDRPDRHPVGMLICNRAGIEDWTAYAGSSTIFTLNTASRTNSVGVEYHGSLGQDGEELLYAEIEVDETYGEP